MLKQTTELIRLLGFTEWAGSLLFTYNKECCHKARIIIIMIMREKTCLRGLGTTKAETSLSRSLISAFDFCLLESIVCRHATSEISIFKLVSVAEETDLSLAMTEIPKTGFVASRPI